MKIPPSLAELERRQRWRDAVAECLSLARAYAEIAEIGAAIGDDAALKHGMSNFVACARTAALIYKEESLSPQSAEAA
jgi:hypothetical protein